MPWHWLGRAAAAVLLVGAAVVVSLQVQVHTADGRADRSCGSPFDVVAARTSWERWWTQDLADPAGGMGGPLLRTQACPAAVNRRILAAGGLTSGAVIVLALFETLRLRTACASVPRREGRSLHRLHILGAAMTAIGALLTVAGGVALILLVANPDSTLFVYVSRPVVALIGLVVLQPAVVLVVAGRALDLAVGHLAGEGHADATT